MSLEQALAENTATLKQLIAVLSTAVEDGVITAPAGTATDDAPKRKRRTKAEIEADAAAAAAPAAAPVTDAGADYRLPGDPEGTRYFHIPAHNTAYKQLPGMPDCTVQGALIVSGAEWQKWSDEYAKKSAAVLANQAAATQAAPSPTAQTVSSPAPEQSPAPVGVTLQSITDKLMAIHKRDGNAGVKPILDKFGVSSVPALAAKNLAEVDAAVEAALNPVASTNLFG